MDLQTFVENTVLAIASGVEAARKASPGVAPKMMEPGDGDKVEGLIFTRTEKGIQPVFMVEFDVAVTATNEKTAGGGGGIKVMSFFSAEGKGSCKTEASTVSRIRFKVPLRLT